MTTGDLMFAKVAQAYAAMDARAAVAHEPGARVVVGPSYRGQGEFLPDGFEGEWSVKERLGAVGGRVDYHLINDRGAEVFMPSSRLTAVKP